jgi:putative acetyltransferase
MANIREVLEKDNKILAAHIREVFEEHDAPKIGTVYSDPTTDDLFGLFRKKGSVLWVATSDEQVYGCCGIYPTEGLEEDTVELVKYYVPARYRGQGIGRELLIASINSARALGYKKVYLESLNIYKKAIDIYKKLGFTFLDHPLADSGHGSCNIWMILNL